MQYRKLLPVYLLGATLIILTTLSRMDNPALRSIQFGAAALLPVIAVLSVLRRDERPHPEKVSVLIRKRYRRVPAEECFCIALEYRNTGKYHTMVDEHFDWSYHDEFLLRLVKLFGRQHVYTPERNQAVIVTRFRSPDAAFEERQREMLDVTREICSRFNFLLESVPVDSRHFIRLAVGTASQGIRREFDTVLDLVNLARFTRIAAWERREPYLIADDSLRSLKCDIDDFTHSMVESFRLDEFNPFFQPVVDLRTGTIAGCESFVRWQKNSYRVIEARKFTEIANEKNLLKDIDFRVINKTFHAIWELKQQQLITDEFIVMINISANTLRELRIEDIRELAHRYGLQPERIEFDIKDQPLTDGFMVESISRLRGAGFRVAIDIFTSDAFALRSFLFNAFDTVKIDKSVLSAACSRADEDQTDIFREIGGAQEFRFYRTIVRAARSMQLKNMLKGVEHRSHLDFARSLKVDYVQGYYFTPPLEQHKFTEYMRKYRDGFMETVG